MKIGENIRMLRKQLGLSQRDLAKKAGVRATLLSTIETGSANPTLKMLEKIGRALGSKLIFVQL